MAHLTWTVFLVCVAAIAARADDVPRSFGGRFPHLAVSNSSGECGIGAVVPWATRLWLVTYAPHARHGSERLPRPTGRGGPWQATPVEAEVASDPYLMGGYDEKTLDVSHDGQASVRFDVEIDPTGDGEWFRYASLDVPPGHPLTHAFPRGFLAQWIRITADTQCRATATLTYR